MKTQTFLIRCEYPDGDHIPTQEFVENIQEYFAANIMDGERGRPVVKPVYQPKRDPLYQACLDAVPEDIKERVSIEIEFSNFVSLVRKMRKAQDAFNISVTADNIEDIDFWHIRMLDLEREVDEYLEKMEI